MAQGRARWGCSYKKTTLVVCSINIFIALYVLRSLYSSLYIYSGKVSRNTVNYTPDQIRKMEESIRIRRASEPLELVKLVKELKEELTRGEVVVQLPRPLKEKITDEILKRLKSLNGSANSTEQRDFFTIQINSNGGIQNAKGFGVVYFSPCPETNYFCV